MISEEALKTLTEQTQRENDEREKHYKRLRDKRYYDRHRDEILAKKKAKKQEALERSSTSYIL